MKYIESRYIENWQDMGTIWQTGPKFGTGPYFRTAGAFRTGPSAIPDPLNAVKPHNTTEFRPCSSESENNNGLAGGDGGKSNRSVFLHAACVADIPVQVNMRTD